MADFWRNSDGEERKTGKSAALKKAARQRHLRPQASTRKAKRLAAGGCIQAPDPASGRASPGLLRQAGEAGLGIRPATGIVTRRAGAKTRLSEAE